MYARHNENMHRRLRVNVRKGIALLILVHSRARNASIHNLAKEAAHRAQFTAASRLTRMIQNDLPSHRPLAPNKREDAVILLGLALGSALQGKLSRHQPQLALALISPRMLGSALGFSAAEGFRAGAVCAFTAVQADPKSTTASRTDFIQEASVTGKSPSAYNDSWPQPSI